VNLYVQALVHQVNEARKKFLKIN